MAVQGVTVSSSTGVPEGPRAPMLAFDRVEKSFGSVEVLRGITFDVAAGDVVGLLGDNGAGKSTLMKVLTGVHQPTGGSVRFEGKTIRPKSPAQSRALGIEMVYQDLAIARNQTVAENIFLGREPVRRIVGLPFLDRGQMLRKSRDVLDELHVRIPDTGVPVANLSGGQQQCVAIARAMTREPKLVVLDEPTAALAVREVEQVLNLVSKLRERGVGIILISHRLNDVFEVANRIVVLRHGRVGADLQARATSMKDVVEHIVGAT